MSIVTLSRKHRDSYAGAGHGEKRRRAATLARPVTPLTYQRMLAKHDAGLNVTVEFTRHACNNPPDESNGAEFAAFVILGSIYCSDPEGYDAVQSIPEFTGHFRHAIGKVAHVHRPAAA